MASRSLGTLTVDLVAKIGGFVAGMTEAERTSKKRMDRIAREVSRAGKAIGIAFAAVGAAIGAGLNRAISAADAINDMSLRTGVSTEALSRLEVAAKLTDTSLESLQTSFVKLARTQQDALAGGEAQQQAFAKLGISLEELRSLNPEQLLGAVADGIKAIENPAAQTAAAVDVLGRGAADLLPLLKEGSAGFAEYGRMADALGVTLSQDAASGAAEFKDQIDLMTLGMDGAFRKAAVDLLPTITELARQINSPEFREGFSTIVTGATKAAGALAGLAVEVAKFTKNLGEGFAAAIGGIGGDDITRLEGRATQLREKLADLEDNFVLIDIGGAREKTREQLAAVEADISSFYERQAAAGSLRLRQLAEGVPLPAGATPMGDGASVIRPDAADASEFGISPRVAAGARDAADALRELQQAQDEVDRQMEQNRQTREAFIGSLDMLEAQLSGPLAVAELEHAERMKEVQRLLDEGLISTEEATEAQFLYGEQLAKTKDQLDPLGESYRALLDDMQFELDLMGKTNAERVVALELRRLGIDLSTKEGEAAAEAIRVQAEALELEQRRINAMDDFRSSFEDNVASVLDGSKSIKDAFRDMVDDFIAQLARMAAQRFTEQLFGQMGSGETGSAGGWLSALFSAFGGARAGGGPVTSGVPYLVGEQGPELMIPRSNGTVVPAGPTKQMLSRSGGDIHQHFHHPVSRETLTQSRIELSREMRKATGEFA